MFSEIKHMATFLLKPMYSFGLLINSENEKFLFRMGFVYKCIELHEF